MLDGAEGSGLGVDIYLVKISGDRNSLDSLDYSSARKNFARCLSLSAGRFERLSSGVINFSLLWLSSDSWPENELILVSVQSLNIELKCSVVGVGSSVINSDSYGSGEARAQFGS